MAATPPPDDWRLSIRKEYRQKVCEYVLKRISEVLSGDDFHMVRQKTVLFEAKAFSHAGDRMQYLRLIGDGLDRLNSIIVKRSAKAASGLTQQQQVGVTATSTVTAITLNPTTNTTNVSSAAAVAAAAQLTPPSPGSEVTLVPDGTMSSNLSPQSLDTKIEAAIAQATPAVNSRLDAKMKVEPLDLSESSAQPPSQPSQTVAPVATDPAEKNDAQDTPSASAASAAAALTTKRRGRRQPASAVPKPAGVKKERKSKKPPLPPAPSSSRPASSANEALNERKEEQHPVPVSNPSSVAISGSAAQAARAPSMGQHRDSAEMSLTPGSSTRPFPSVAPYPNEVAFRSAQGQDMGRTPESSAHMAIGPESMQNFQSVEDPFMTPNGNAMSSVSPAPSPESDDRSAFLANLFAHVKALTPEEFRAFGYMLTSGSAANGNGAAPQQQPPVQENTPRSLETPPVQAHRAPVYMTPSQPVNPVEDFSVGGMFSPSMNERGYVPNPSGPVGWQGHNIAPIAQGAMQVHQSQMQGVRMSRPMGMMNVATAGQPGRVGRNHSRNPSQHGRLVSAQGNPTECSAPWDQTLAYSAQFHDHHQSLAFPPTNGFGSASPPPLSAPTEADRFLMAQNPMLSGGSFVNNANSSWDIADDFNMFTGHGDPQNGFHRG